MKKALVTAMAILNMEVEFLLQILIMTDGMTLPMHQKMVLNYIFLKIIMEFLI